MIEFFCFGDSELFFTLFGDEFSESVFDGFFSKGKWFLGVFIVGAKDAVVGWIDFCFSFEVIEGVVCEGF